MDLIVKSFNERWFLGWEATPEEQRVKFLNIAQSLQAHPDFQKKYSDNADAQNREVAFRKVFDEVIGTSLLCIYIQDFVIVIPPFSTLLIDCKERQ